MRCVAIRSEGCMAIYAIIVSSNRKWIKMTKFFICGEAKTGRCVANAADARHGKVRLRTRKASKLERTDYIACSECACAWSWQWSRLLHSLDSRNTFSLPPRYRTITILYHIQRFTLLQSSQPACRGKCSFPLRLRNGDGNQTVELGPKRDKTFLFLPLINGLSW